jgi:hypothetical protein
MPQRITNLQFGPRGCLINYGQLSGALPAIELTDLMDAGSVFVTKYGPRAGLVGRDEVGSCVSEALTLASTRQVTSGVAALFTLDRVVDAYTRLESNPDGKVLILPHSGQAASGSPPATGVLRPFGHMSAASKNMTLASTALRTIGSACRSFKCSRSIVSPYCITTVSAPSISSVTDGP